VSGPAEITDCEPPHAAARTPHAPVSTRTHSRALINQATPEPVRSLWRVQPAADPEPWQRSRARRIPARTLSAIAWVACCQVSQLL